MQTYIVRIYRALPEDKGSVSGMIENIETQSDIDVLVEFESGAGVGMIRLAGLELELGEILGRRVDLNTPGFLSKYYRDQVLSEAEVQYDASR